MNAVKKHHFKTFLKNNKFAGAAPKPSHREFQIQSQHSAVMLFGSGMGHREQ